MDNVLRSLKSSTRHTIADHRTTCYWKVKTKYGKRAFSYVGQMLWNALPLAMRMEENLDTFKKGVKTMLFEGTDLFKKRAFKYN